MLSSFYPTLILLLSTLLVRGQKGPPDLPEPGVSKSGLEIHEQAMFFDDFLGLDDDKKRKGTSRDQELMNVAVRCGGDHSGAVSMNNPGCLRSEADRQCVLIGPETFGKTWCLNMFDDDDCQCQSMGMPLAMNPGRPVRLSERYKSYSFSNHGCPHSSEWKCVGKPAPN